MYIPSWTTALIVLFIPYVTLANEPNLGQPLSDSETKSLVIWPDGRGLPLGSGTPKHGRTIYEQQCMACHGAAGKQGLNDTLVGGQVSHTQAPKIRTIGSYWPYATSLYDYIRRAMPYNTPGSLTNDQVYAVVSYLLFLNGIIEEDTELDATTMSQIKLPNRDRFFSKFELP